MKVLWIVQGIMKEVAKEMGGKQPVSGTWLEASKDALKNKKNIELHILCVVTNKSIKEFQAIFCDGVRYYVLPVTKDALIRGYNSEASKNINNMIEKLSPDIIHVHGTEFSMSLNIDERYEKTIPICHSIQGLVSSIAETYFYADLPMRKMSFLEKFPIQWQRSQYLKRGKCEKEIIRRYQYFFGRTDWDVSHIIALNPDAKYIKVRELFREVFFESTLWQIDRIQRHTLFYAGGARVPLKGFHKFLDALELIKQRYPDVLVYVSGIMPNKRLPLIGKIGYGRYLDRIIKSKGLSDNVIFTGPLSGEEMAERFISSHCYVLGSSIENSPNTLVEAMLIGVPSVVASVGGVKNFATHQKTSYLYRFEETEMIAYYIGKIFEDDTIAKDFSVASRKAIRELLTDNQADLLRAYEEVINDFKRK